VSASCTLKTKSGFLREAGGGEKGDCGPDRTGHFHGDVVISVIAQVIARPPLSVIHEDCWRTLHLSTVLLPIIFAVVFV
jgi:hypothetical protein